MFLQLCGSDKQKDQKWRSTLLETGVKTCFIKSGYEK